MYSTMLEMLEWLADTVGWLKIQTKTLEKKQCREILFAKWCEIHRYHMSQDEKNNTHYIFILYWG